MYTELKGTEITLTVFPALDNVFHVYLMSGILKYEKNTLAFWDIIHIIHFELLMERQDKPNKKMEL